MNEPEKNAEAVKPFRAPRQTEMSLRVNYTERELLEIGKKLAEANRKLEAAESEKKGMTATLKARCDSIASTIQQHSGELTNGYTYRQIPCTVHFDLPAQGMKTTIRLDTGEQIETCAMTLAEMQADLPLSGGAEMGADGKILTTPRRVSSSGAIITEGDGFIDAESDKAD